MRYLVFFVLVMLIAGGSIAQAPPLEPITADNGDRLELVEQLGYGRFIDAAIGPDESLLVATSSGLLIYPDLDLSAEPQIIAYEPNPFFDERFASFFIPGQLIVDGSMAIIQPYDVEIDLDARTASVVDSTASRYSRRAPAGDLVASWPTDTRGGPVVVTLTDASGETVSALMIASEGASIGDVAFSADGSTLYVVGDFLGVNGGDLSGLHAWDVETATLLNSLSLADAMLLEIFPTDNGPILADDDRTVIVDGETLTVRETRDYGTTAVSPDGSQHVAFEMRAGADRDLHYIAVYDAATGDETSSDTVGLCSERSVEAEFSADGARLIAYGSGSGPLAVFDMTASPPERLAINGAFGLAMMDAVTSPDGETLYAAMDTRLPGCSGIHPDTGVHVYDLNSGERTDILRVPGGAISAVALMSDGTLVTGAINGVVFWRDGEIIATDLDSERYGRGILSLDAGTDYVVAYLGERTLAVWNAAGERVLATGAATETQVRGDLVAITGDTIIFSALTGRDDVGAVSVMTIPDGEVTQRIDLPLPVKNVAIAGGQLVVHIGDLPPVEDAQDTAIVYTLEGGEWVERNRFTVSAFLPYMDLSPDGSLLSFAGPGGNLSYDSLTVPGTLPVYDTVTGGLVGVRFGDRSVAFGADGRRLFTVVGAGDIAVYGVPSE